MNFYTDESCSAPVICETPFGLMLTTVEKVLSEDNAKPPVASSTASRINPFQNHPRALVSGEEKKAGNLFRPPSSPILTDPKPSSRRLANVSGGHGYPFLPRGKTQRIITLVPPVVAESISTKHSRTKVFSGVKNSSLKKIESLLEISTNVVKNNPENLLGYDKLSKADLLNVLKKASVKQLRTIEKNNPGICDTTNEIWKIRFEQDFKGVLPFNDESWRDAYYAAGESRRINLQKITKRARIAEGTKPVAKSAKLVLDDTGFLNKFDEADGFFIDTKGNRRRAEGTKRSFPNSEFQEQPMKKFM